MSTAAMKRSLL